LSVGLNCALGAAQLKTYIQDLSRVAGTYVSAHPNAGLPNEFGAYDQSAEEMAGVLKDFVKDGLLNIVGGCCGTTPTHIKAIAKLVEGQVPRQVPTIEPLPRYSGLEPLTITKES